MTMNPLMERDISRNGHSGLDRQGLVDAYQRVRRLSEDLAAPLEVEDMVVQSMPDASPTKWHLAHTTWFFETFVVLERDSAAEAYHPDFSYLFNSYYNTVGDQYPRPRRGLVTRPTVERVMDYRRAVDEKVLALLGEGSDEEVERLWPVVEIGLHHEQQHQELLLTDIKHLLSQNPLHPTYVEASMSPSSPTGLDWLAFDAGLRQVGHTGDGFGYDNEFPRHQAFVHAFEIADRLVTAGEYKAFIADGGYSDPGLWLSEGWGAVQTGGWDAPLYWTQRDGQWWHFTLTGAQPVDDNEPVTHVSHFEADAYARWAGARLPTEFEWEVASEKAASEGVFVEDRRFHPAAARAGDGLRQMFGDTWEWTASPYVGYPGYTPPPGAIGEYNGKFMSNQMVLRGGSCATSRTHIRPTYRNFFPSAARWQFSGIRLARDVQ